MAYVQCTLGKTPPHAEKGETSLFIGGDQSAAIALTEIFSHMGIPRNVGTVDAACAVKLISNIVGMANLAILSEGLKLGEAAGLSPSALLQLLKDTGARSFQMDARGPRLTHGDHVPPLCSGAGAQRYAPRVRHGQRYAPRVRHGRRWVRISRPWKPRGYISSGGSRRSCNGRLRRGIQNRRLSRRLILTFIICAKMHKYSSKNSAPLQHIYCNLHIIL